MKKITVDNIKLLYIKSKKIKRILNEGMEDIFKNPKKKRVKPNPTKYIHIGYPKSGSTAIQKGYLRRHNQLYHLGCGAENNKGFWDDHGYINEEINIALEVDLRYKNSFSYDADKTKAVFEKAQLDEYVHAVGISNENFCFNWHGGIDISEKARRLNYIFGEGTQIIMVIRNQKKLIESLYKETVRFGYPGTFEEYLKNLWIYKDRNYFYEFHFNKVVDLYSSFFGRKNVHVLFFEDLKLSNKEFLSRISKAIGVDCYDLSLKKQFNKQLSMSELYIKREMNSKYPHTFGSDKFTVVDNHRYIPFYSEKLLSDSVDEIKKDYKFRNLMNKLSRELNKEIDAPEISMSWDSPYGLKILDSFSKSNQILEENNIKLQDKLNKYRYSHLNKEL